MTKEIPLTKGYVAIVDDEDFEELSRWKWHALSNGIGQKYAARRVNVRKSDGSYSRICIRMHRQILRLPVGDEREGDHVDGNTLNNTRGNLRTVNRLQNCMNRGTTSINTSGVKGVRWHKGERKWYGEIKANGRRIYLGSFAAFADAVDARKEAERTYFGEYARREAM